MSNNEGKTFEKKFAKYINGKTLNEMNDNMKEFVLWLFDDQVKNNVKFKAEQIEGSQKPDVYIQYQDIKKYVSIKSGESRTVHQEKINKFVNYLKEHDIDEESIDSLLYFFYNDGTVDGTGVRNWKYDEMLHILKPKIKKLNEVLNKDKAFVEETLNRLLFNGAHQNYQPADCIYYGSLFKGNYISKREIKMQVKSKSWDYMETLHIGPITLRPHVRYPKNNQYKDLSEYIDRLDFKWPTLAQDFLYIKTYYID